MRPRIALAAVLALAVLVAIPAAFGAKPSPPPGNSGNAKACQKGGWQNLLRDNGTSFADEAACTSYAAMGGALYPASAGPCLPYTAKATAEGNPFASVEACLSYVTANPGKLVSCTRVGTSGNDTLADAASGEVICGFGGADTMTNVNAGGVFYGGAGGDLVANSIGGIFNGGDGDDYTGLDNAQPDPGVLSGGVYNGGGGNDGAEIVAVGGVFNGDAGNDYQLFTDSLKGTFNGGADNDSVAQVNGGATFNGDTGDDDADSVEPSGTFNGGAGNDSSISVRGTFNGGDGNDFAEHLAAGTYDGGPDTDTLCRNSAGTVLNVEITSCA